MPEVSKDADRFRQWQIHALEARPAGSRFEKVGPFSVVVPSAEEDEPWVTLVDTAVTEAELVEAIERLRARFDGRTSGWQVEFNDAVMPSVEAWLVAAGLELVERNPLMACRPPAFKPFAAGGISLQKLDPSSPEPNLEAFQQIRWTDGGEFDRPFPTVDRLLNEMSSPSSVYLLAWLDGVAAGTGVLHPLNGAAEIVGIVTRMDKRRRGVGATVTSDLVARHFASGGEFVFLDASGERAASVYARLGFTSFGTNVVYR